MRESSHTIARDNGLPVLRLHTTVVSRWLVTPIHMTPSEFRNLRRTGGRTDDLYAATLISRLLELGHGLFDDLVAHVLYFCCVVFVPSDQIEARVRKRNIVPDESYPGFG